MFYNVLMMIFTLNSTVAFGTSPSLLPASIIINLPPCLGVAFCLQSTSGPTHSLHLI